MRDALRVVGVVVNRGCAVKPVAVHQQSNDIHSVGRNVVEMAFGGIGKALNKSRERQLVHGSGDAENRRAL